MPSDAETSTTIDDSCTRHNVIAESFFSAFNGIVLGLAFFASPVVALSGLHANALQLTIIVAAFPFGTFLGPLWGAIGQRIGMQNLVNVAGILGSVPLFCVYWVAPDQPGLFTALLVLSQLFISAMRVGQSSLYRVNYNVPQQGRIIGWLNSCNYFTMIPSTLLTGILLDEHGDSYRYIYPAAAVCGFFAAACYRMLRVPAQEPAPPTNFHASFRNAERVLTQDRIFCFFQLAFFFAGSAFFMSRHIVIILMESEFGFRAGDTLLWLTVIPQLILVLGSPIWGWVIDHIGILRCRLLISVLVTCYLASFSVGIIFGWVALLYIGCIIHGIESGGGQLTWWMASSFAPRSQDVPMYTGIHFVLNGVRGIFMPWLGTRLFLLFGGTLGGAFAVVGGFAMALVSIPFALHSLTMKNAEGRVAEPRYEPQPVLEPVAVDISESA